MNRTTSTRILSTSLSLALAISSMPMRSIAAPVGTVAPAFADLLSPSAKLGYVASSYAPKNEERPRLVVIADLHGHVEVQHNIKGMLENLVEKLRPSGSTKPVPVFVEGGWEPGLEEPLREVSNKGVRSFMSEYFLQKAEINASQAYSEQVANQGKVVLIGAETKAHYIANRARFLKTYPERKALLLAIAREEEALKALASVLSGNSFKKLQVMRDNYLAGRMAPEAFASKLSRLARKYGIQDKHVEILKNAKNESGAQLEVSLSQVYQSVILASSKGRPVTALFRQSLDNEAVVRENLARIDASLDLLKRLVANQLTPAEVPLVLARMPELVTVAQMLLEKNPLRDQAAKIVRESLDFYPFAMARDKSLCDNSIAALDKMGPEATGILITGGFHTEAISERLRLRQIPHLVLHPSITRDITTLEHLNYVKRIGGEHVTIGEIQSDVKRLERNQGVTASAPAKDAANGLDAERGDPGTQKMLNGLANQAGALAMLGQNVPQLTAKLARTAAVVQPAVAVMETPSIPEAATQMQKAMRGRYTDIAGDIVWDKGITLERVATPNGMEYKVTGQPSTQATRAVEARVNKAISAAQNGAAKVAQTARIHIVPVANTSMIQNRKTDGEVIVANEAAGEESITIVLAEGHLDGLVSGNETSAALADHTLGHEILHAFDEQGKSESATTLRAMAYRLVQAATNRATSADPTLALRAEIGNLMTRVNLGEEGLEKDLLTRTLNPEELARIIARLVDPGANFEANVQAVYELLAKRYEGQVSGMQLEKIIASEITSASGRLRYAMANNDDIPPAAVDAADKELGVLARLAAKFGLNA